MGIAEALWCQEPFGRRVAKSRPSDLPLFPLLMLTVQHVSQPRPLIITDIQKRLGRLLRYSVFVCATEIRERMLACLKAIQHIFLQKLVAHKNPWQH